MKATGLKIGDLVKCDGRVVKITALGDTGVCVANIKDKFEKDWTDSRYLNPIPLTEGILEKNEWYLSNPKVYLLKGKILKILVEKDNYQLRLKSICTDAWLADIKYVHQLQHILWVLGIDDNLKV